MTTQQRIQALTVAVASAKAAAAVAPGDAAKQAVVARLVQQLGALEAKQVAAQRNAQGGKG